MLKTKNYGIVLTFILVASFLCIFYSYLYTKRDDINISIETVTGNIDVIENVTFKGDIIDSVHKISYSLTNGIINKTFTYGNYDIYYWPNTLSNMINYERDYYHTILRYYYKFNIPLDAKTRTEKRTELGDGIETEVTLTFSDKFTVDIVSEQYRIRTDVIYNTPKMNYPLVVRNETRKSKDNHYKQGSYVSEYNKLEYVDFDRYAQTANDTYYLITLTDENCSGYGGLYAYNYEAAKNSDISVNKNLLPIDLEDGNVKIIHFKLIGEKIVIILSKNNMLYANIYDIAMKHSIGEMEIGEELTTTSSFIDSIESNGYMVLKQKTINNNIHSEVYHVIDIDNLTVLETVQNDIKVAGYTNKMLTKVLFKEDTLFVLYDYEDILFDRNQRHYPDLNLRIFAFSGGEMIYEGEILTGAKLDSNFRYQHGGSYLIGTERKYFNMRME